MQTYKKNSTTKFLIILLCVYVLTEPFLGFAQTIYPFTEKKNTVQNTVNQSAINKSDSIDSVVNQNKNKIKKSELNSSDSVKNKLQNIDTIPLVENKKASSFDAQIDYTAKDSIVLLGNGIGFLHGESNVKFKKIDLKANFVRLKMDSSLIFAHGTQDSLGKKIGEPVFKEGESEYKSKELNYNLKTKKGFIRQAVTQQGEGFIISDRTKKTASDALCISGGKYTTCDNHDHPDFYLSISKGKVKPGSYIVTGPAHLVIADVPLPLIIPFGFFPFTSKYSSGVLMPSYTDELTRGFGLTNGGYYFAINDYMDMELKGDIYTKGTWAVTGNSTYLKRYKYRGNFSLSYRNDVTSEKDLPDYSVAKNMSVRWSHSQDAKANPFRTLSASVDFSSSGYDRSNINSFYKPQLNSANTRGSSISFSQRFPESPFTISGSMLVNQRTKDSTISLTLPNINVAMSRIYPFKRKNAVGKELFFEKIAVSYSANLANSIDTKENALFTSSFSRDWRNGIKHSIPVNATFNVLKYINITPSFNYNERWYLKSIDHTWDTPNQREMNDTTDGFKRVYDYNVGVSAQTKIYGYFIPIRAIFGDKVDRIRHVLTPSVGFNYTPDFGDEGWGFYRSYTQQIADKLQPGVYNNQVVKYSRYASSLYGTPGIGESSSINFSLGNNVEMKLRNDKDTTGKEPFKVISLIDNFLVSGGYNFAADSMRWSIFNANVRLKLGKSYNLSLSGAFDPYLYALSSSGYPVRVDDLRWNHGKFPRFLGTSTSYSYTLNNETFSKIKKAKPKVEPEANKNLINPNNPTELTTKKESEQTNDNEVSKDGYQKVKIPWSISINYSIRYGNTSNFDKQKMEYDMDFTHNLSLSGNLSLTKNWNFNSSTSYDFKARQFTYTNINITRNLHCWTMSASVVPFGPYQSYNFRIGVNASMLQDLKYNQQSSYGTNNITWY